MFKYLDLRTHSLLYKFTLRCFLKCQIYDYIRPKFDIMMKKYILTLLVLIPIYTIGQASKIITWDIVTEIENVSATEDQIKDLIRKSPIKNKSTYYLKNDTLVRFTIFDSVRFIKTISVKNEDFYHYLVTLDGKTTYKKVYLNELSEQIELEHDTSYLQKVGKIKIGPFNCETFEINNPNIGGKITFFGTKDIDFNIENKKYPFKGMEEIGTLMGMEFDMGILKIKMNAVNFNNQVVEPSIFLLSLDGVREMDFLTEIKIAGLMSGVDYKDEESTLPNIIPLGDGDYNDLYRQMCNDNVIWYCDLEKLKQKPSFDKPALINLLTTSTSAHEDIQRRDLEKTFVKYDLISVEELQKMNSEIDKIDNEIAGSNYVILVNFFLQKNMLDKKTYRQILVENLNKNNFISKNPNHPEVVQFLENKLNLKSFLTSYKGIYDLKMPQFVKDKTDFLIEVEKNVHILLPNLQVSIHHDNSEIQLKYDSIDISYPINTEYYASDIVYDENGNIIKNNDTKFDFEQFSKSGLLDLLRQIGADFGLEYVFDIINSNSILSHYLFDEKYSNIKLFEGELFLCIDKNSSSESFSKEIPFTKTNYNLERDNLSSIHAFYASNPGIDYVPLSKKVKLFEIIKMEPNLFGMDSLMDGQSWFKNVKNRLYTSVSELIQSVPEFGSTISTSALNGVSYNKFGNNYHTYFPKLSKLFGTDFEPQSLHVEIGELNAELTFSFNNKQYQVHSDIFKLEADFLKKIIFALKENSLYTVKQVYQTVEDLTDVQNKKLFYITNEFKKELMEEFELLFVDFK